MRIYDPLSIALLGLNLMTGAFGITNYKAALGPAFFSRMGVPLAWKLLFAFLLINLAAYIAFGIGHRLVSRVHWDEPLDASWVDSMLKRLQASMVLALLLLGVIVWIALGMTAFSASPAAG
jgi:cation transporter-like permease